MRGFLFEKGKAKGKRQKGFINFLHAGESIFFYLI